MRQYFTLLCFLISLSAAAAEARDYSRLASPMLINANTAASVAPVGAAPSPSRPISQALEFAAYKPVISPYRLNGALPGIVRDGGLIKVTYQFDENPADEMRRPLSAREKQIVREVLQQLSGFIPLSFSEDKLAYLRFTAAAIVSGGVEGFANLPEPTSASLMGGQVVLDQSLCAATSSAADCDAFRRVVRHEMGHVMGLQHPWEAGAQYERMPSIMSYEDYRDYQPADIAALQHLYGAARGSRMLADARAVATEKNTMENVLAEMQSNPAQALKAALSETNPTAPPRTGLQFAPQTEEEGSSGIVGTVLDRIFSQQ